MELFYFPVSPFSHKVLMALDLKGLACEKFEVLPFEKESHAAYREIYPLGKLPLLRVGDELYPESSFIVEYLDTVSTEVLMLPKDEGQARAVRLKDRMVDQYLSANTISLFFQSIRPEGARDVVRMDKWRHEIVSTYAWAEQILEQKESDGGLYFHGDSFSLADLSLVSGLRIASGFVPFDRYPKLSRYYDIHSNMPCFQAVAEGADEMMGRFIEAVS